jgi:uncharacterized protein (DUF2236 family)
VATGASSGVCGIRRRIGDSVRRSLGASGDELGEYTVGAGDRGLFGPDSPVWAVHGDLPSMLIGGFAALMNQTLHPLAMAGVAAHSNYRDDPTGRLRRTARFVAGTTFGSTAFAHQLIDEVTVVHARVRGVAPDGRRYSASDPALLTFVHVTEVGSFLASYQRYATRPLLRHEKDRYLAEVAVIAEMLGARDVPHTVSELRAYQRAVLPQLDRGAQADDALRFLARPPSSDLVDGIARRLMIAAAIELLPDTVHAMVAGRRWSMPERAAVRAGGAGFAAGMRWAVGPSVVRAMALARIDAAQGTIQQSVQSSAK